MVIKIIGHRKVSKKYQKKADARASCRKHGHHFTSNVFYHTCKRCGFQKRVESKWQYLSFTHPNKAIKDYMNAMNEWQHIKERANKLGLELFKDKDNTYCLRSQLFNEDGARIVRFYPNPCEFTLSKDDVVKELDAWEQVVDEMNPTQ